jgi:multidrug efflux pump subunit AcrA (membrane-fusion protein)
MELEGSAAVKKRGLAYASLAILAALIGCTFVSRSVQTALKTSVDTMAPRRMELAVSKRLAGAMEYENTVELRAEASYTVAKVLCRVGDRVREGTPIAEIDVSEFERGRKLKELELLRAENALAGAEAGAADSARSAAAQRGELELQHEIAREEYDEFVQSYPADGLLRSEISGIVAAVYVEDRDVAAPRQKIAELREDGALPQCVVWLPEEEARVFEPGDSAAVSYPKLVAANGKTELVQASA